MEGVMDKVYNPEKLRESYRRLLHGNDRLKAIKYAITEADKHNDLAFMVYFREELCYESSFYCDSLDMMVVFPEILSIIDQHPDIPATRFESSHYNNAMEHVLWIYKWVIASCTSLYQIPLEDCQRFFEDFKNRYLQYGYSLRPYYKTICWFYEKINREKAKKAFHMYRKLPRDRSSDCKACERMAEIDYYISFENNFEKASELAKDIEEFKLKCGDNEKTAWMRLKGRYMDYYKKHGDFKKAIEIAKVMIRCIDKDTPFHKWDDLLYCYAYINLAKGLKIYKDHWKEWQQNRNPCTQYEYTMNICCFWKAYSIKRKRETTKLLLDASFPFYNKEDTYKITDLFGYYYNKSKNLAEKFDKRNGTGYFGEKLEERLAQTVKAATASTNV